MNSLKNISLKNFMNFPGFIILTSFLITLIGFIVNSQSLAAEVNLSMTYLAPFENSNFILGTDGLGRSVAYGLMNGIKVSLLIAIITAALSFVFALFFSYLAGYLGNERLRLSVPTIMIFSVTTVLSLFYLWYSPSVLIIIGWLALCFFIFKLDNIAFQKLNKKSLPLDTFIMKYVALQKSLPGLFLILFVFALTSERSMINMIAIITFSRIPSLIRLSRSEVLKIKNQEFVVAAEAMGIKSFKVFTKHIVPNILTPIRTYLIYSLAATVLIESTLSFLGLGLSVDTVTLGSMLSSSRDYFSAWWLAILPGSVIFLLIYSLRKLLNAKVDSEDYAYL